MVDKKAFLEEISEILEVEPEEITLETNFRKGIPYWDSLKGFSILILLEDEYGTTMTVDEFLKKKTLGDLYNSINEK